MPGLLRSLIGKLRGRSFHALMDVVLYASLTSLNFNLWLYVFRSIRSDGFGVGDAYIVVCLLLILWFAYKRTGLPYASALLGIIWAAYRQSQH